MAHPTRSFEKPTAQDRFRVLPGDVGVEAVVRRARSAGLGFMTAAAFGLRRVDLRAWLSDQYAAAVAYTRIGPRALPHDERAELEDRDFERHVRKTRERVLVMVQTARRNWSTPTFAREMIDGRLVMAIYDRTGAIAYAPAAYAEMRLIDRVFSLFVADFLSDATDYALVTPCDSCGDIGLGGRADHASWCADAPTCSGIVERVRGARATLRGVG